MDDTAATKPHSHPSLSSLSHAFLFSKPKSALLQFRCTARCGFVFVQRTSRTINLRRYDSIAFICASLVCNFKSFIEEASRRYADALVSEKREISKLVDLFALIGRMKILSSDAVIEAAENAGRLIVNTYLSPKREFSDLPELMSGMDPFRECSDACRNELRASHPR